jgi:hypothetical protein
MAGTPAWYESSGMYDEPEEREWTPRIYQIEIMHGNLDLWVTFKDEMDVDESLRGRVYRNPTASSLKRLARATHFLPVDLVVDGNSLITNLLVGECPY